MHNIDHTLLDMHCKYILYIHTHTHAQVGDNGVISFDAGINFPSNRFSGFPMTTPLIGVLWVDFEPDIDGTIYSRQSTNTTLLQMVESLIMDDFTPTILFISTWDGVAFASDPSQVSLHVTLINI